LLHATISASASGDNTVVAAVVGKKIRVNNYLIVAAAAVSATWKSGASTSKSGALPLAANGGVAAPGDEKTRWFETAPGEALVLNLSGAVLVAGHVTYTV
jgi:hypothetical protein